MQNHKIIVDLWPLEDLWSDFAEADILDQQLYFNLPKKCNRYKQLKTPPDSLQHNNGYIPNVQQSGTKLSHLVKYITRTLFLALPLYMKRTVDNKYNKYKYLSTTRTYKTDIVTDLLSINLLEHFERFS